MILVISFLEGIKDPLNGNNGNTWIWLRNAWGTHKHMVGSPNTLWEPNYMVAWPAGWPYFQNTQAARAGGQRAEGTGRFFVFESPASWLARPLCIWVPTIYSGCPSCLWVPPHTFGSHIYIIPPISPLRGNRNLLDGKNRKHIDLGSKYTGELKYMVGNPNTWWEPDYIVTWPAG